MPVPGKIMFPGTGICHKSDAHSLLIILIFQVSGALLNAQSRRRVAGEHLPDPDVPGEHLGRLVAGLAHDVALADAVHRRLGDASSGILISPVI